MFSYRLGLDIGANSLGWSVLELNEGGEPCAVRDAGVRIFSDGRGDKSKATLKADRRAARSARRCRDRYKQRRDFLLDELTKAKLFPEQDEEDEHGNNIRDRLQKRDPLELRAKAITEPLKTYEIGRALFHLNQRRGFKSNRKDAESREGVVKKSARELENKLAESGVKTFGQFLWQRRKVNDPTRARRHGTTQQDLYNFYPTREMLEYEFDAIWDAQAEYHPEFLTEEIRKRIRTVIFTQRPLRRQKVGKCTYMSGEDRMFKAMPSFQRYRIYQEVNNLEWRTSRNRNSLIHYPDARDNIVDMLERPTTMNGIVTFGKMKKVLIKMELAEGDFQFNFETPKRKGFDGNHTSNLMQDERRVGPQWHQWSLEKQDEFIRVILDDDLDDQAVQERLMGEYHLSKAAAMACTEAPLTEGMAALSKKAAHLLLAKMKDDMRNQTDAVQAVAREETAFDNPSKCAGEGTLLPRLPYYGEVFQDGRHIIPGSREEDDKDDDLKYFGGVTNPTVHIALNQIRHVVNELLTRYGHPASIAIELGRELPAGKEGRAEIEKEQKENQKVNERLDNCLRKQNQACTRDNRLRLRLWEELDDDPNGRCCPFSGQKIGIADLFNGNAETEHLIPFSRSLDDSRANKVICTRQANRDKGQRTPYEAFGDNPDGYNWEEIFRRSKKLPKNKHWRFQKDALEIWERDHADFLARHLNDTRYIGRLTKEYLENICPFNKIDVLTGRLTALLRGHWGLHSVLSGHNQSQEPKKNRDDHRHHAVDAIVIGMTSRPMLQKVATAANRAEKLHLERLFDRGANGEGPIDPWPSFRDDVKELVNKIIVSHKPNLKTLGKNTTDGQLHNETAYGIISVPDDTGCYRVVVRCPINELKRREHVEAIRDKTLRHEFLQAFEAQGTDGIVRLAKGKSIRRIRCTERMNVIPIKDRSGKEYKAYKGDSNWGMEIYEYPNSHTKAKAGKWDGEVISRYEANQKEFQPGQTKKPHPAARLVMRLQINDCVEMKKDGRRQIMRLQKLSKGKLTFAPHNEANVDARNDNKNDPFKYFNTAASTLKKSNARKVHISPAGRVSYEKRRKPHRKH